MRSLASALSIKRAKSESRSQASAPSATNNASRPAKPRSATLFAKAPKTPVETDPHSYSRPALTPASSSSSDGSASLRTPEDDGLMAFPKHGEKKGKWGNWFGWRKPSEKHLVDELEHMHHHHHRAKTHDAYRGASALQRRERDSASDTDDDGEEDSDSDTPEPRSPATDALGRPLMTQATLSKAQSNLRTLIRNSLSAPSSPPPLVLVPNAPRFPRSSNSHRTTPIAHTFETTLHLRRMLRRLERRTLSRAEVYSIANLGARPQPAVAVRNASGSGSSPGNGNGNGNGIGQNGQEKTEDDAMSFASMRVVPLSRGLRDWAARPCFEARVGVWLPDDNGGEPICRKVMGVGRELAVADLEFSDRIDALSGLSLDEQTFEQILNAPPPMPKGSLRQSAPLKSPSIKWPSKPSFTSVPSPLRPEQGQPAKPVLSPVSSEASTITPYKSSFAKKSAPQRGVRFVPDNDDDVPLGYAVQAKKKREEKERFLQVEREKREKVKDKEAREATRQAALEERRRAEEEQRRIEEEKRRIEEERKRLEDLRMAKYAEEVAAARHRRETARTGAESFASVREAQLREREPSYTRPTYDPKQSSSRRHASDYTTTPEAQSMNGSPRTSTPPSLGGSTDDVRRSVMINSGTGPFYASMEDLRPPANRRQSGISVSSLQEHNMRSASEASTSSRHLSLPRSNTAPIPVIPVMYPIMYTNVPPVPPMPIWNMPLLPPAPPFMMQQYPPSPSGSHSNSHSRSRDSSPSASRRSSGLYGTPPSGSSPSLSRSHATGGEPSRPRPHHSRTDSGDHHPRQPSALSNDGHGNSSGDRRKFSRSSSYVAQPSSASTSQPQPHLRDDHTRKSSYISSSRNNGLPPMDSKRRTAMM